MWYLISKNVAESNIFMIEINVPVMVACGYEHTLALTNEGEVFAWGKNNIGQLGSNYNMKSSGPIMVIHE